MIMVQRPSRKFKCKFCLGEFILTVIKDPRKYQIYQKSEISIVIESKDV